MVKRIFISICLAAVAYAGAAQSYVSFDSVSFGSIFGGRNLVDKGRRLGDVAVKTGGRIFTNEGIEGNGTWKLSESMILTESLVPDEKGFVWNIALENTSSEGMEITDLSFKVPMCSVDRRYSPESNMYHHESINGDASYLYWLPYSGEGQNILMTPLDGTGIEFADEDGRLYIHSKTSVDRVSDSWRLSSTAVKIPAGGRVQYGFRFTLVPDQKDIESAIYENGGVNFRVVPGMVIASGQEAKFALRNRDGIKAIKAEHPQSTVLSEPVPAPDGFQVYNVTFAKLGENWLEVEYGKNKTMRLDFFVTEDLGTVIRKRAAFIVEKQQHKDTSKWYNGLYSLYNSESGILLSPDNKDVLFDYMVGGSDDPSNSKPVFLSEKNAVMPDPDEIASLEYYEKNFVWGKLQRTDKEFPYPYGIYGTDNWWMNRSGKCGDYQSGGSGRERMWRTYDYVTHIAIYYNLYRIARDNPSLVKYLNADGYLDRAYNTAMAYFTVPYNIIMGRQWSFHGWCDWAYKLGNFHERYILDLISALEEAGRTKDAEKLRREWEKKVTYMVYENPWPFGSEMFVDRTAFESSYYIGEYALKRDMVPQEQFWYDKNLNKWYSYKEYPQKPKEEYMQKQLRSNLTLRAIHEPSYQMCGAAWIDDGMTLDYMCQMGGVALLDYGTRFADNRADIIRYGYNSLLSSWALIDTCGAAGWAFSIYQNNKTWVGNFKAKRKPMKYDGEIDHGFTGGVHGAGCYIVKDPVFGTVAYGGVLEDSPEKWIVDMRDGVGQILVLADKRFEMRLENNGIISPVEVTKDLSKLSFTIGKRIGTDIQRIRFMNLPEGEYEIMSGRKVLTSFTSTPDCVVLFDLHDASTSLVVKKVR